MAGHLTLLLRMHPVVLSRSSVHLLIAWLFRTFSAPIHSHCWSPPFVHLPLLAHHSYSLILARPPHLHHPLTLHSSFTVPLPTSLKTPHLSFGCSLAFLLILRHFPLFTPHSSFSLSPPTVLLSHSPTFSLPPAHLPFPSISAPTLTPTPPDLIFTFTFSVLLAHSTTHLLRHLSSKDLSIFTLFRASW